MYKKVLADENAQKAVEGVDGTNTDKGDSDNRVVLDSDNGQPTHVDGATNDSDNGEPETGVDSESEAERNNDD